MSIRRLIWLGGIAALLGCVPVPASPDAGTDATGSEHVEDALDSDEGAAPSDGGPPAPDGRADIAAEVASDVAPDAPPDARVDAAPNARDAEPDLPDAADVARDVAADLPPDRADAPIAMDALRDVPADDAAPFDAPADAAPPDGLAVCGDAPVAADARRDDAGRPCGQIGQPCCSTGSECMAGLGCVTTYGFCAPFGEVGGPCFPDGRCGAGLRCEGPGTGHCTCSGSSDSCGTAVGWACRELVSVAGGYQYACCRGLGAACCQDSDCCGRTAGAAACRGGVCANTGSVCSASMGSCRSTPCCAPLQCELPDYVCRDGS